jgi:hypothetical protein
MPGGPIADTAVLDPLGPKVVSDNRALFVAPAFLDIRIIVVCLVDPIV